MIKQNLNALRNQIIDLEQKYAREINTVSILAVSKQQSIEKIREAIAAGQVAFGENYVQEALIKINELKNEKIEWHFIGPVQSNKTRDIAANFAWVHSVDREKIVERLNAQRADDLPRLNVCIEVNISQEKSKSGVMPDQVAELADKIQQCEQLKLRGLMAIPVQTQDFAAQRQVFNQLQQLYIKLKTKYDLDTLSMGMSGDYEAAIAEGATMVRIGTGIFGKRGE